MRCCRKIRHSAIRLEEGLDRWIRMAVFNGRQTGQGYCEMMLDSTIKTGIHAYVYNNRVSWAEGESTNKRKRRKILKFSSRFKGLVIIFCTKVKQSRYRPGVTQTVPGSYVSQISWQRHRIVVRFSDLRTGRLYPQEMLLVLISVRGWANPRDTVRSEGWH